MLFPIILIMNVPYPNGDSSQLAQCFLPILLRHDEAFGFVPKGIVSAFVLARSVAAEFKISMCLSRWLLLLSVTKPMGIAIDANRDSMLEDWADGLLAACGEQEREDFLEDVMVIDIWKCIKGDLYGSFLWEYGKEDYVKKMRTNIMA